MQSPMLSTSGGMTTLQAPQKPESESLCQTRNCSCLRGKIKHACFLLLYITNLQLEPQVTRDSRRCRLSWNKFSHLRLQPQVHLTGSSFQGLEGAQTFQSRVGSVRWISAGRSTWPWLRPHRLMSQGVGHVDLCCFTFLEILNKLYCYLFPNRKLQSWGWRPLMGIVGSHRCSPLHEFWSFRGQPWAGGTSAKWHRAVRFQHGPIWTKACHRPHLVFGFSILWSLFVVFFFANL